MSLKIAATFCSLVTYFSVFYLACSAFTLIDLKDLSDEVNLYLGVAGVTFAVISGLILDFMMRVIFED